MQTDPVSIMLKNNRFHNDSISLTPCSDLRGLKTQPANLQRLNQNTRIVKHGADMNIFRANHKNPVFCKLFPHLPIHVNQHKDNERVISACTESK